MKHATIVCNEIFRKDVQAENRIKYKSVRACTTKTMKLRVKFRKYGSIRFIGHLDVMRFFQKCIRRAQIDVAYTGGFSPHQIMSFAAPLGVGLESNGEYMDIEVHSIISCEDVKNRLNAASVPGIEITSVKILPENAGNAMASVAAASYTVRFREGREPKFPLERGISMEQAVTAFLAKEEILIQKKSKKSTREVDLKPGIYEMFWQDNAFHMLVDASSAGNLKPGQIIETLLAGNGEVLQENALLITREDTFTDIGDENAPKFVPLDNIGYEKE